MFIEQAFELMSETYFYNVALFLLFSQKTLKNYFPNKILASSHQIHSCWSLIPKQTNCVRNLPGSRVTFGKDHLHILKTEGASLVENSLQILIQLGTRLKGAVFVS